MLRRATLILMASGCVAGVVGCGGDPEPRAEVTSAAAATATPSESGSAASSTPPSADERAWAGRVNAICERNSREMRTLAEQVAKDTGETDRNQLAADVIERAMPKEKAFMGELRDIDAPVALAEDWDAFLDGIDRAFALFPRLIEIVRKNESDPEFNTEMVKIAADTRPFAQSHGLLACLPDAK